MVEPLEAARLGLVKQGVGLALEVEHRQRLPLGLQQSGQPGPGGGLLQPPLEAYPLALEKKPLGLRQHLHRLPALGLTLPDLLVQGVEGGLGGGGEDHHRPVLLAG
ncbi:hypothetical protein [Meiothermus taiwanensis]|uniref:hypothetical protein n=1 Tax=Meiothermus taiwanensis TaxID=172827 RepID=UPI0038B3AA62